MELGKQIATIRKNHKMSQEDLAAEVNVSRQAVTKWESGEAIPELEKLQENRMIPGKDQLTLFCSVFRANQPRGTVLVLHGFTENAYKYSELIFSLVRNRFTVVAYDQRGHGRSGRNSGLS